MDGGGCFSVSDGMPEHPKILAVGGDAAWLWTCALAYCKRNRTDGILPASVIPRLSDRRQPAKLARRLIEERLMHEAGHECKECVQPLPAFYVLHGYIERQGSAAEEMAIQEVLDAAREAKGQGGVYGNHRRWHVGRGVPDPSCEFCSASHDRSDTDSDNRSHMRSDTDQSADHSPNRIPNRTTDDHPSLPPHTPPSLPVDITPPTPPPSANGKARRKAYDYGGDQDFLRFWDAYPQKSGKPAAYRAWLAARARGADADRIIRAAERYRDDPRRNPDHTKYPQGWLNDERYNDEASTKLPTHDDGYWDE